MAQVTRTRAFSASASDVWAKVGAFESIGSWHPAAESAANEEIGGVTHRRIRLEGGGEILEKHLGGDGHSYGYEIIESPLPVRDYRSVFTVNETANGCLLVWVSTFEPTADGAEDVIAGIYEGGFDGIAAALGG